MSFANIFSSSAAVFPPSLEFPHFFKREKISLDRERYDTQKKLGLGGKKRK